MGVLPVTFLITLPDPYDKPALAALPVLAPVIAGPKKARLSTHPLSMNRKDKLIISFF